MTSTAQDSPRPHSEEFPTYPDWLASHADADIAGLLWRLYSHGSTALLEQLSGTAHPEPALHHLTAVELAILHAATEIGAATHSVTLEDLQETLTELFDIAGTAESARPSEADIHRAVSSLAHWGLLFGQDFTLSRSDTAPLPPTTRFKVPAHIPPHFEPATENLWRLADCNRCPIPTGDLSATIEALPPRQRRLLGTLSAAGGVGHSASLRPDADPTAPLPTMVRQGVLDQLDESTARLSGRVSAYLRRTLIAPVGGVFSSSFVTDATSPPAPSSAEADMAGSGASATSPTSGREAADAAAVASVVQRIQELTDTVTDVGEHPIQPLGAGGIGLRELNKIARRRNLSNDRCLELITDLYLANFLAREFPEPAPEGDSGRTYWAITESALDFVEAPLATQWAMLLLGWAGSPYTTWMTCDEDIRPMSPELHVDHAADLRGLFAELFTSAGAVGPAPSNVSTAATTELWRVRPALAWDTAQLAWDALLTEAERFGLFATLGVGAAAQPTSALEALSEVLRQQRTALACGEPMPAEDVLAALSLRLSALLPDPVSYLIIQGDHTIMAPGLLTADNQRQLAQMAEQESAGMASVWRVTKSSLLRAFARGATVEGIESFLDRMAPGGLSAVPQSLHYLVMDAQRAADRGETADGATGAAGRTPSRVPAPSRTLTDPTADAADDLAQQIDGAVEGFRRAHDQSAATDPSDGTSAADTRTVRAPREVMSELRRAYGAGTQVRLHYVDYAGATSQEWISIVMMTPSTISAVIEATGETISVQPHRIAAVDVPR